MATEETQPQILRARDSAVFEHGGQIVRIIKGQTTVEIGAAILKGREHLFEPLVVDFPKQQTRSRVK